MTVIFLDSGPLISLTTNNLLWLIGTIKERKNISFNITESVRKELVDVPLKIKRFKFEALQVNELIRSGVLDVVPDNKATDRLLELANGCLTAKNKALRIMQRGEIATIATAIEHNADAIVIDERITRLLVERPSKLALLMKKRLHTNVNINNSTMKEFGRHTKGLNIFRSVELVTVAYENGLLDKYISDKDGEELLESVLWAVKLHGAAVSEDEIAEIIRIARHSKEKNF